MPRLFSTTHRIGLNFKAAFEMGAIGCPILPINSDLAIKLFRNLFTGETLPWLTIEARARAFISAIFTPVGQTILQILQPLQ
jgi:hypothetical protein